MMNGGTARFILYMALLISLQAAPYGSSPPSTQGRSSRPTPLADSIPATLALQIRLDRMGFSPGVIDGQPGTNTRRAVEAYRRAHGLRAGDDTAVRRALEAEDAPLLVPYVISAEDAAGPFVPEIPSDPAAEASLPALSYTSVVELIGERVHASPGLLRTLNPGASFVAGETLRVPNVARDPAPNATRGDQTAPARLVTVSRRASGLTVYDAKNHVIFFAPVTSGSEHDPLPLGRWTVTAVVRHPSFNYNPDLFWDADPTQAKAKLPPGPNGPVGTVWIDLSKEHYGIHGTPEPSNIGHTESHGCVRLTNWDAETVAGLVRKGTAVRFEP